MCENKFHKIKRLGQDLKYCSKGGFFFFVFIVSMVCAIKYGIEYMPLGIIKFDQYAVEIFGTTAGIIGTMFGLTAASYAFIWGALKSDGRENRHLERVVEIYNKKLWHLFVCSLLATVLVVFSSLGGMALTQKLTETNLYKTVWKEGEAFAKYYNHKHQRISWCVLFNLVLSVVAVGIMARMNWVVFKRNIQYAVIARRILKSVCKRYDMELKGEKKKRCISQEVAYEKIHNLEILVERILKNHESIGEAFAESQRREKLLSTVIYNGLKKGNDNEVVDRETDEGDKRIYIRIKTEWSCLEEKKRDSRWEQCHEWAKNEIEWLEGSHIEMKKSNTENTQGQHYKKLKPCDCSFITVYEDLLLYRNNSLVWEEMYPRRRKSKEKNKNALPYFIDLYERRALRYTIKKRLLIFYLRGETFAGMDLSGISFSGADLRYADFSDCNLTGIRLKGANCEGTDFTRSKMIGMYFCDDPSKRAGDGTKENESAGEIQLTCEDDSFCDKNDSSCKSDADEAWDPYHGREATYLQDATFKEADVSRAYLNAPGEIVEAYEFPFGGSESNEWKLGGKLLPFSLQGTNFDNAKIYFSFFKNIDFTNASLCKALMYNAGLLQTKAKHVNLSGAVLTHTCMVWCDFANADFSDASLSETILARTNFSGAKMVNVNFSFSNIISCNFEEVSCQNASFKNAISNLDEIRKHLPEAFNKIDLKESMGISFRYATLTKTDFSGADLRNVDFGNAIGQDCIFTKAKGNHVSFENAIFLSSILNSIEFNESCFINTMMGNSVFANSQFMNCLFYETDFSESLFNHMKESYFVGGGMYRVDFSGTRGIGAKCFYNISLNKVNFRGTGIFETDFKGKGVTLVDCIFSDGGEDGKH